MDLVRDLLDKAVVDRHGREMGRVDSVIIEVRPGKPARVSAIEIGPAVLAHRILPVLGRWMAGLEHALGIANGRPLRISLSDILDTRDRIKVDCAVGQTAPANLEKKLRNWVSWLSKSS